MVSPKKKKKKVIDNHPDDMYDTDIVFEETDKPEEKIKEIKEKLNRCLKESRENLLGWQRARADFVNAKKENDKKVRESSLYAKSEFIAELLPVIDSFEMAFSNKEAWEKVDKNWRIGVEYIHSQITSVLENNGVKQINPTKKELFDPKIHIPMDTINTNDKKEDGMIDEVMQKGYELNGNVLRAAKVRIKQFKE